MGLIAFAVMLIGSVASHILADWLAIKVFSTGYRQYGPRDRKPQAILYGSSVAYSGIDWSAVSEEFGEPIRTWPVAGSSPAEWEQHDRSPEIKEAIVVISPFDMDEYFVCDFRANVVPLFRSIHDLWQSGADWQFCKSLLSQYPLSLVRALFPTAGRSDGVMVGIRAKLLSLANASSGMDAGDAPRLDLNGPSDIGERMSDWSAAHLKRRMALMRTACKGRHSFSGLKRMALERLLRREGRLGKVVVIILPQPLAYRSEFFTDDVESEFERFVRSIEGISKNFPEMRIVRIDSLPALNSNDLYYDPVHLNKYGQRIATASALGQLKTPVGSQ